MADLIRVGKHGGNDMRCVAYDFDSTLAHFIGGREGLFQYFTEHGVAHTTIKEAYEATKQQGFSIRKLIAHLRELGFDSFDPSDAETAFNTWLASSLRAYPDALPSIASLKAAGIPTAAITYGDPAYQARKMGILGVACDRTFLVGAREGKPDAIRKLIAECGTPVAYIDNKASELDRIRDAFPGNAVMTIRIRREDDPYRNEHARHHHQEITNLAAIVP